MNNLIDTFLLKVESFASRPSRFMKIADMLFQKVLRQEDGLAYPCWYEYRCGPACLPSMDCPTPQGLPGAKCRQQRRQCCCHSQACGAWGCGPWGWNGTTYVCCN